MLDFHRAAIVQLVKHHGSNRRPVSIALTVKLLTQVILRAVLAQQAQFLWLVLSARNVRQVGSQMQTNRLVNNVFLVNSRVLRGSPVAKRAFLVHPRDSGNPVAASVIQAITRLLPVMHSALAAH